MEHVSIKRISEIFNTKSTITNKEKTKKIVKLEELIPDWWGYDRV